MIVSEKILQRMRQALNVETNKELSHLIKTREQTVSGWKTRNTIGFDSLIKVIELTDNKVTLDWLVFGKEKPAELSTHERMALIAFNQLSDEKKLQALKMMDELK